MVLGQSLPRRVLAADEQVVDGRRRPGQQARRVQQARLPGVLRGRARLLKWALEHDVYQLPMAWEQQMAEWLVFTADSGSRNHLSSLQWRPSRVVGSR